MEGYLESFLYLLITIVILIFSMRKKRQVETEDEEAPVSGDHYQEIIYDEDPEEYETRPAVASQGRETMQAKSSPWMSEKEAGKLLIDADQVMKEAADNNPIAAYEGKTEEDAYGISLPGDEGIPFDLKRAVIYSEVLNRRQF
jgi:hypothetical protein